jgi:hypothetical protein
MGTLALNGLAAVFSVGSLCFKHIQKLHTDLAVIILFFGQVSFSRTLVLTCALCFVGITEQMHFQEQQHWLAHCVLWA